MADSEWYCVETPSGTQISKPGEVPAVYRWPNKEAAIDSARAMAVEYVAPLSVVKYTRKEVKTFTKKVTVEESDPVT